MHPRRKRRVAIVGASPWKVQRESIPTTAQETSHSSDLDGGVISSIEGKMSRREP